MSGQQASSSGRADGRGPEEFRSICERSLLRIARPPWISPHERIAHFDWLVLIAFLPPALSCCSSPMHACAHAVVTTKVISQAKGSAYAEFGTTKVMAGV